MMPPLESTPYLLRRICLVRGILEQLSPQAFKNSPLLVEAYGGSLYKCPVIRCSRFQRGFTSRSLRDEHLRSHDRAHRCTTEGCDYSVIGFPTIADLTRHEQLCHCELGKEFSFPSMKRASLSQSLKDAIDRDNPSAVRALCAEMSIFPINETGFLFRAVKRKSFGAAFVLLESSGSDEICYKAKDQRTVLHEAVETMNMDFLKKILTTDVDINAEDFLRRTPLAIAIERKHFDAMRLLLSATEGKPKVNIHYWNTWRKGFIAASSCGHDDIVRDIFPSTVEQSAGQKRYQSLTIFEALVAAASNNHEKTVKAILDIGREMNLEKTYPKRLLEALRNGNGMEAIKLLKKPEIDGKGKTKGNALANAARNDDSATVLGFLEKGADINYGLGLERNALQEAAKHGKLSMVRLLLENGADIYAQPGKDKRNALQLASCSNSDETVQLLLARGIEINSYHQDTDPSLQLASCRGHDRVVQLLLDNGAHVNAQGRDNGTALYAASLGGYYQVVRKLLGHGADVNVQGGEYGSALQAASKNGHEQVLQMLLDNGADVNVQGGEHGSALQAASFRGLEQLVRMLLDHGADVNAQGGHYDNALQAASTWGRKQVVQMLLDNGADVNAQGGRYGTALQAASRQEHTQTVELLRRRGAEEGL